MRPLVRRRFAVLAAALALAVAAVVAATLLASGGSERSAFREPAGIDEIADRIEKILPAQLARAHVPGAAVALVHRGDVVWVRGFGVADARSRAPVTPATRFQVGSLSKPVTAWGAVRLAQRGVLPLDAPLVARLRPWPLPRSLQDREGITPRRLLSHTAGLSVDGYLGLAPGVPLPSTLASLRGRGPAGAATAVRQIDVPGHAWRYSGGGYTLLQYAIEQATGRPFAAWARSQVLAPLGMRASAFGWPPPLGAPAARGHDADGRSLPGYRHAELAAAGLATDARDLGRFVAALLGGRDRRAAAALGEVQPGTDAAYGLGLHLGRLADGTRVLSHEGVNRGWHARLLAYPQRGWGVVVLTNGDGGGAVADALQRQFER